MLDFALILAMCVTYSWEGNVAPSDLIYLKLDNAGQPLWSILQQCPVTYCQRTSQFSLSHRPTLIAKSIVFWRVSALFHEKCNSLNGTWNGTHNFCSIVCCPPRKLLAPWWIEVLPKIGWLLLECNWITGIVLWFVLVLVGWLAYAHLT